MSNYVFESRKGENMPITRQQAYRILNNAAEMIGLVEKDEKGTIISGQIGTHFVKLLDTMLINQEYQLKKFKSYLIIQHQV